MLTIAILIWLWMALLDAPDNVILQGTFFSIASGSQRKLLARYKRGSAVIVVDCMMDGRV
jgi:hypothetical protein